MIKRLGTLLVALAAAFVPALANEEFNITLEQKGKRSQTIDLNYGLITFTYVEYDNYNRVEVTLENTTPNQDILLFKNSYVEPALKKEQPKIEFDKKYPGSKNTRKVYGCNFLKQQKIFLAPADKEEIFKTDVSLRVPKPVKIPLYLAKFNGKKSLKKAKYTILSEDVLTFNLTIKGWTEADPEYVQTKNAVEALIRWVNSATFCDNPRHTPSLSEQQRPYSVKRDSLINVITAQINNHYEWMSQDAPHIAYTGLKNKLENIRLNARAKDCGKHAVSRPMQSCSYCSLSAQEIYHQLDDLYQQLRAGKISKEAAVKKANALNTCYQRHNRRKKDSSYADKISRFYGRITSY